MLQTTRAENPIGERPLSKTEARQVRKSQIERLDGAARELGCDESELAFENSIPGGVVSEGGSGARVRADLTDLGRTARESR